MSRKSSKSNSWNFWKFIPTWTYILYINLSDLRSRINSTPQLFQPFHLLPCPRWVVKALEERPINQTARLLSVTPVLMRGPEDRKALRCRLPGPPMAFAAQRVREEAEDAEKVEFLGWKGGGKGGKTWWKLFWDMLWQVPSRYFRNPVPILEVDYGNYENLRVMETWMRAL